MLRHLAVVLFVAVVAAGAALVAQAPAAGPRASRPPISTKPWPDDEVLTARRIAAENRQLFQSRSTLEFSLSADFGQLNRERSPNNGKKFPAVLTVDGTKVPVSVGSRGHLRLTERVCDFVPLRIEFAEGAAAGTVFDGHRALKLGTHCRNERDFDQYVIREYLAYRIVNLATPLSFRARLARATYVDARSGRTISTRYALFLEDEDDVARRLGGREARVPHMVFKEFDPDALTTTMLVEYMLGNVDYSIWVLHNVFVVQDKRRRFLPVAYDFDLSGMVRPPYAGPDPRLPLRSVTDRMYRGPCRSVEEFEAVAEPFRSRKSEMLAALDAMQELQGPHRTEMKRYLEGFFDRIATRESIKKTFVDGCPASRNTV